MRIWLPERLWVLGRHGAAPGLCASCASSAHGLGCARDAADRDDAM
ncbi:hypothetical protein SLI_1688 [Streptomyces lividans 1326]|uniref:Uncharacterized protein n=1 Tax=Streptomyces lividans 1326 TaxID=1200984 RepID=A0A7U9DSS3_STRLI|nr:hypothetical protein SLI_1688 [Streptomyces lividans 1326]